ncbi:MAG: GNAT family N-acetyltransferase [Anaerolineae bacterium]
MAVAIRPAQPGDLSTIRRIAQATWQATYPDISSRNRRSFISRAYSDRQLSPLLTSPQDWFYVAQREDAVIAFAHFLQRAGHNIELARLYVLPARQRQGVGTALLCHGLAATASLGFRHCFASVHVSNAVARRFYEKHGFTRHRSLGQPLGDQLLHLIEYRLPLNASQPPTRVCPTF